MAVRVRTDAPVKPGAAFEQPFEMLEACHERVHRMLDLLHRLREHLVLHGPDDQARQAARDVMRYFDLAAPEHHRDEELHVFPALMAGGDARVHAVVARLQDDHVRMESHWKAARAVLAAVSDDARAQLSRADEAQLDAFAAIYGEHILAEEEIAYPAARPLLEGVPLQAMARDMMIRRGLVPD